MRNYCAMLFLVASLLYAWRTASGQQTLREADIRQIVSVAVRAAMTDARVGVRNQPGDERIEFDTVSLSLANARGDKRYPGVSLASLDLGVQVKGSDRDDAFDCPPSAGRSHISPDCVSRRNLTFVRVFFLEHDSPNTARIWVSILTPRPRNSPAFAYQRFLVHTVEFSVRYDGTKWGQATPGRRVAG